MNERRRSQSTDVRCPRCGTRAIPILRGLPSAAAFEAADCGEIYLGECAVTGDDPDFACTGFDCGLHFG